MVSDRDPGPGPHSSRPLWAPWRIDYIRSIKEGGCFLCERAGDPEGDAEGLVIARGRSAFVLMNAFPYNSGHLLVAPYRHAGDLVELEPEERDEIMALLVRAREVLGVLMEPEGFNLGFNLGAAGGAGVRDHVHGHVVPRWVGDTNFMPVIGDVRVVPEALERTAGLLRETWQETVE